MRFPSNRRELYVSMRWLPGGSALDPEHEIGVGELYKRPDGRIVAIVEIVGDAINYRLQGTNLLEGRIDFWARKNDFIATMEGPVA